MIINILIVVVFLIAFGSNLRADYSRNESIKYLSKPLLVPSIILFYAVNSSGVNSLLIMALFFGFVGSLLFIASDSCLAYQFAKDEPKMEENINALKGEKLEFMIMATYVIAQTLIMLGFLLGV